MAAIDWLGDVPTQIPGGGFIYLWSTAADWSGGALPTADDDVDIPAVSGPELLSTGQALSMTVEANGQLIIGDYDYPVDSASYSAGSLMVAQTLTLDGAIALDNVFRAVGGSALIVGGALDIGASGGLDIGDSDETIATTTTLGALNLAGRIVIQGGAGALAKVDVHSAAGFGQAGVLTGTVLLFDDALIDFLGGGGISTIAAGASLTLEGAHAFLASGAAIGASTALTTLSAVDGDLTLLEDAELVATSGLAVGDGVDAATVDVDTGASLHAFGAITINAKAELDVAATSVAAVYAQSGLQINGGTIVLGSNAIAGPIQFTGAGGTLDLTGQARYNLSGSNGTVNLTDSTIRLTGGGFTVNYVSASGNSANLIDTGAEDDTVNAVNGSVYLTNAAATIVGENDTAFFVGAGDKASLVGASGPLWDRVYGSNGEIDLVSGLASVIGGGDVIRLTGIADELRLLDTDGAADTVYADDQQIFLASAQANIVGGGDKIAFSSGQNNSVGLSSTNGNFDVVTAAGAVSGLVNMTNAEASVAGGGDVINLYGADTLQLLNGDFVDDSVYATDQTITLASAQATIYGGGNDINFSGGGIYLRIDATRANGDTIAGSYGNITLSNNSRATITGLRNSITFLGDDDMVTLKGPSFTSYLVYGNFGSVDLMDSSTVSINGYDDSVRFANPDSFIEVNSYDSATITGSGSAGSFSHPAGIRLDLFAQATVIGGGNLIQLEGLGCVVTLSDTTSADSLEGGDEETVNLSGAQANFDLGSANINFVSGTTGNAAHITGNANVVGSNGYVSTNYGNISISGNDDTIVSTVPNGEDQDSFSVNGNYELFDCSKGPIGLEWITGFNSTDQIEISKADAANFQAMQSLIVGGGATTQINLKSGFLTLYDVNSATLTASEFKFV